MVCLICMAIRHAVFLFMSSFRVKDIQNIPSYAEHLDLVTEPIWPVQRRISRSWTRKSRKQRRH